MLKIALLAAIFVGACGTRAKTPDIDPINCMAAFLWVSNDIRGTELQGRSEATELRIRGLYEYERASKLQGGSDIEAQVKKIAEGFDRDTATKVAKGCLIEQEMGNDYHNQRLRLIEADKASRTSH